MSFVSFGGSSNLPPGCGNFDGISDRPRSLDLALEPRRVYSHLGFGHSKLPAQMQGTFGPFFLRNRNGDSVVFASLLVNPSRLDGLVRGTGKHRVFVVCPCCGGHIPFGRWHQHAFTKACPSPLTANDRVRVVQSVAELVVSTQHPSDEQTDEVERIAKQRCDRYDRQRYLGRPTATPALQVSENRLTCCYLAHFDPDELPSGDDDTVEPLWYHLTYFCPVHGQTCAVEP